MTRKLTLLEFINKANSLHCNKYDYSKSVYINNRTKLTIICKIHGEFTQRPGAHLRGASCPTCGTISTANKRRVSLNDFIQKANLVHNNKYTYKKADYLTTDTKVIITCFQHGDFKQTPYHHLKGRGCPGCAEYGFNQNKPGVLYYLKVTKNKSVFYKIGITNLSVQQRFGKDMEYIKILKQTIYQNGKEAYLEEQRILRKYKKYRYKGPDLLKSGNTELFTKDILNMNNLNKNINKAIGLQIIKPQIQIALNKTEMNALIVEALANPDTAAAVKRAITPLLADSFPQFPEFTNVFLGETLEDGTTLVTLKQPAVKKSAPAASIEPEPVEESEPESPAYVEPDENDSAPDTDVTGD